MILEAYFSKTVYFWGVISPDGIIYSAHDYPEAGKEISSHEDLTFYLYHNNLYKSNQKIEYFDYYTGWARWLVDLNDEKLFLEVKNNPWSEEFRKAVLTLFREYRKDVDCMIFEIIDPKNGFVYDSFTFYTENSLERFLERYNKSKSSKIIRESDYFGYYQWGWIDPNGKVYTADERHQASNTHSELLRVITNDKETVPSALRNGWARWFIERSSSEMVLFVLIVKQKLNERNGQGLLKLFREYRKDISSFHLELWDNKTKEYDLRTIKREEEIRKVIDEVQSKGKVMYAGGVSEGVISFKSFLNNILNESHYLGYYLWGWIDPNGKIYSQSEDDPEEYEHSTLIKKLTKGKIKDEYKGVDAGWVRWVLPEVGSELYFHINPRKKYSEAVKNAILKLCRENKGVYDGVNISWEEHWKGVNFKRPYDIKKFLDELPKSAKMRESKNQKYFLFGESDEEEYSYSESESDEREYFAPFWGWIDPDGKIYRSREEMDDYYTSEDFLEKITGGEFTLDSHAVRAGWVSWGVPGKNRDTLYIKVDDNTRYNQKMRNSILKICREFKEENRFGTILFTVGERLTPFEFDDLNEAKKFLYRLPESAKKKTKK